jgi:hypothetical protein
LFINMRSAASDSQLRQLSRLPRGARMGWDGAVADMASPF